MITLNLVPPEKKKNLRLINSLLIIKNNLFLLFFVIVIATIILLIGKAAIDEYFAEVVSQSTLITKYARIFNYEIKDFNQKVIAANEIQEKSIPWIYFLSDLSEQIPAGVTIDYLEIKDGKIVINGNANTRNDLLQLKNNLENFSILSNINIPIESLLKKENIDFNLKAAYDSVKLKNYE